ncbi:MAG TPA: hypothetical protein VLZ12_03540 [Verrucomicrobiae bacterium]|nr:hypothetical protein [Verrucomicrobiae bacterium]
MIAGIIVLLASAINAPAQGTADIAGNYSGSYEGPNGATTFSLSITGQEGRGTLAGVLTSHSAGNPDSTSELAGFYSPPAHRFQLRSNIDRTAQRGARPSMLMINGTYDPNTGKLSGTLMVSGSRPVNFEAARGGAEAAKTASAPAEAPKATTPATQPAATAQAAGNIDGVYNGTCTPWNQERTFKLALRTFDNGTLAGIMTLYDPFTSHEKPHSYGLNGTFEAATGKFKLAPPSGQLPFGRYFLLGLTGAFDRNTGKLTGTLVNGPHDPFEATRDAAESANIASLISSPASALATDDRPKPSYMSGVYTGFVGCAMGGKMNAKLSLKVEDSPNYGVVTGVLTVDLPADVGSPATYKLTGNWHLGSIRVDAMNLGAQAPFTYAIQTLVARNTEGMGAIATHLRGDVASRAACEIDVSRDEAQSAKLDEVMAAQSEEATNPETLAKAAAHEKKLQEKAATAQKEQASVIKTAAPKQLASKDVVRKSQQYWSGFHDDLIREIFDGGFGDGIGDDTQFEILFTHYVEAFDRDCKDHLPAKHESVTMTQSKELRDIYGNYLGRETVKTWTVECDSRFAPYYKAYALALVRRATALVGAVAMHRASMSDLTDPVEDIERFFKTQKCDSAAMHQFTENLLRAAEDKLSLQQAGEKVAGAEKETDPNLPPGKYTHFVDGCNGWYRDPKNAHYKTGQSSAWCQCLAEKYRFSMSLDEQYYYANDFGPRFRDAIAQPQSTDPAWNRFHQAVEDCRQ